jgi:hypothetical protein
MKKILFTVMFLCVLFSITVNVARAQSTDQLQLGLTRDFGYGGFNNDIQGLFTAKIKNPPTNVVRVDFYLDSTKMGEDNTAPFSLQFNTDSYPLGVHKISAVGTTTDGTEINSNIIEANFVPAGAGMQSVVKIVVPIFVLILLIALISIFLPLILSKGKFSNLPLGSQRKYGIGGGAICPKCSRPFPLRLWWLNTGFKKIDRCPYCGKWSYVRRLSIDELRKAEATELANAQPDQPVDASSDADNLKKELDDSRFQDT